MAEIVSLVFNTAYMVLAKVRGISDQDVLFLCMFNNTFDIKQSHYCAHRNRHSGLRDGFKADVQKQNKTKQKKSFGECMDKHLYPVYNMPPRLRRIHNFV